MPLICDGAHLLGVWRDHSDLPTRLQPAGRKPAMCPPCGARTFPYSPSMHAGCHALAATRAARALCGLIDLWRIRPVSPIRTAQVPSGAWRLITAKGFAPLPGGLPRRRSAGSRAPYNRPAGSPPITSRSKGFPMRSAGRRSAAQRLTPMRTKSMKPRSTSVRMSFTRTRSPTSSPV